MTDRVADSTIKGFLYQFNKTICEIIDAENDDVITVEGVLEDIDVLLPNGSQKAIQCKYHESKDSFTPSLIFKPLLQMAVSFDKNPSSNIDFVIFIHVNNQECREDKISLPLLESALITTDKSLLKIRDKISTQFDKEKFIDSVTIKFGPSLDELEYDTKKLLESFKIKGSDVDTLLYPNAISKIAKLSSCQTQDERKITKLDFYNFLCTSTHTAISKWTLALKNRSDILIALKKQLATSFAINSRDRYIYLSKRDIDNFDEKIVVFLVNYVKKYHYKIAHIKTPTFIINDTVDSVQLLEHRLYKKGLRANTGMVGNTFEIDFFYREPLQKIERNNIEAREFDIRLLAINSDATVINYKKCDDLYIVSNEFPDNIELTDIDTYQIGVNTFSELEFVMGMKNSHE